METITTIERFNTFQTSSIEIDFLTSAHASRKVFRFKNTEKFMIKSINIVHNLPIEKLCFNDHTVLNRWFMESEISLYVSDRYFFTASCHKLLTLTSMSPIRVHGDYSVYLVSPWLPSVFNRIFISVNCFGSIERKVETNETRNNQPNPNP